MPVSTPSKVHGNIDYYDSVRFLGSVTLPADAVNDAAIDDSTSIDAEKLEHVIPMNHFIKGTVAADDIFLGIINANYSDIVEVDVVPLGVIPTSTKAVTVDIQIAADGGSFTSLLSSVITINSSSVLRTVQSGSIDSDGTGKTGMQIVKAVIAVSGSGTDLSDLGITVRTKQRSVS